jgi:hypothetical protein
MHSVEVPSAAAADWRGGGCYSVALQPGRLLLKLQLRCLYTQAAGSAAAAAAAWTGLVLLSW